MGTINTHLFLLFILIVSSENSSEPICVEINDIDKECSGELLNGKHIKINANGRIYCCAGDVEKVNEVKVIKSISLIDRLKKHFYPEVRILCNKSDSNETREIAEYISAMIRECVIKEVQNQLYKDIFFDFILKLELSRISKGYFRGSYAIDNYENSSYSNAILQCNKKFVEGIGDEIKKTYDLNRCVNIEIYACYIDDFIGNFDELVRFHNEVKEFRKVKMINKHSK